MINGDAQKKNNNKLNENRLADQFDNYHLFKIRSIFNALGIMSRVFG